MKRNNRDLGQPFPPTLYHSSTAFDEKWYVTSQDFSDFSEIDVRNPGKPTESPQNGRGIAASTSETRAGWNILLKLDFYIQKFPGTVKEGIRSLPGKVR